MIFVDSSFWIALTVPRDTNHASARELLEGAGGERLLTTNHVRGESWTFLRRRAGHRVAIGFLDLLGRTRRLEVERVSGEQEDRALRWLRRHDEREYSFVDATSFAVMRALRIGEAFAFDSDFTAAGFRELRP